MERRIPVGPLVAAIGAVLLLVSLCLDWWEDVTGFTAFEALDLVLVALALLALLALAGELGVGFAEGLTARHAHVAGAVALVIVLTQLVNDPPLVLGDGGPGHAVGIWLALGGAVLMAVGGLLAGTRISLAVDVTRRDPSRSETGTVRPERPSADDPERS
ncbi:MAG TPA: hypothetical protein VFQ12_03885 [Thermoleophilaceae bacterium]|nr:hypothetical protein [Thermoleophilaceae bacterium]